MFTGLPSLLASSLSFCRCSKYAVKILSKLIDTRSKSSNISGFGFQKCAETLRHYVRERSDNVVRFKKRCSEPQPGKKDARSINK